MANDFSEQELELLSHLVGLYLETDDLNHVEWAQAKELSNKIEDLLQ